MMRPVLLFARATVCLLPLTTLAGCYSMYRSPYGSPYPYQGPASYGAPVQTLQPGMQPYTPGVMQGPVLPNTYAPSGQLSPVPNSNGAPNYNPAPGGVNNSVPNPYMPMNSTQLNNPQLNGLQPVTNNMAGLQPVSNNNNIQPVANNSSEYIPVPLPANAREFRVQLPPNQVPRIESSPLPRMGDIGAFERPIQGNLPAQPGMLNSGSPADPYAGQPKIEPLDSNPFAK